MINFLLNMHTQTFFLMYQLGILQNTSVKYCKQQGPWFVTTLFSIPKLLIFITYVSPYHKVKIHNLFFLMPNILIRGLYHQNIWYTNTPFNSYNFIFTPIVITLLAIFFTTIFLINLIPNKVIITFQQYYVSLIGAFMCLMTPTLTLRSNNASMFGVRRLLTVIPWGIPLDSLVNELLVYGPIKILVLVLFG